MRKRLMFTESLQNFQTLQVKLRLKNPFANNSLMGYMESPEVEIVLPSLFLVHLVLSFVNAKWWPDCLG